MSFWSCAVSLHKIFSLLDFCIIYFMTLLGRCTIFSVPVLVLILLLRKTIFRNGVFAKGAIWAAMLPVLFLGKLAVYYESRAFLPFILWQSWCSGYWWVRYGYLFGVIASLAILCRRRAKLRRMLRGLPMTEIDGQRVYLCDMPVSPFTAGVLFSKIVIPTVAREQLDESELHTILLHERTHIRLAHLWYFLLWDILCAALWVNPFLRMATPKLKEDMEHICDAVTIRRGDIDAVSYGRVILRSLTLLREQAAYLPATFTGESDFADAKQRMRWVRDYRPYSRRGVAALCVCAVGLLLTATMAIDWASFPQYTGLTGYTVFRVDEDVNFIELYRAGDDEQPPLTVIGKDSVEVDNVALRAVLPEGSPEDGCYYIMWGGFLKMPGIGGAMNAAYVRGLSDEPTSIMEFQDVNERLCVKLVKWM